MCTHCRHKDLGEVGQQLRRQYPIPKTGPEKKSLWKNLSEDLRLLKKARKVAMKNNLSPYLIDFHIRARRFAMFVLKYNFEQNGGWKNGGWMNAYEDSYHGQDIFVA